jgi:hypothetical protein
MKGVILPESGHLANPNPGSVLTATGNCLPNLRRNFQHGSEDDRNRNFNVSLILVIKTDFCKTGEWRLRVRL